MCELGEVVTVTLGPSVRQPGLRLTELEIGTLHRKVVAVRLDHAVALPEGAALFSEVVHACRHARAVLIGGFGAIHHGDQLHLVVSRATDIQEVVKISVACPSSLLYPWIRQTKRKTGMEIIDNRQSILMVI